MLLNVAGSLRQEIEYILIGQIWGSVYAWHLGLEASPTQCPELRVGERCRTQREVKVVAGQAQTTNRHLDHQLSPPYWLTERDGSEPVTFCVALTNALAPVGQRLPSVTLFPMGNRPPDHCGNHVMLSMVLNTYTL